MVYIIIEIRMAENNIFDLTNIISQGGEEKKEGESESLEEEGKEMQAREQEDSGEKQERE